MSSKVKGVYLITYVKDKCSQRKNLVSHDDFINDYKPRLQAIAAMEIELDEINKKKHKDRYDELASRISSLKSSLKSEYGEFFTDNSPLWNSQFNNGMMSLPKHQGGDMEVKLQRID